MNESFEGFAKPKQNWFKMPNEWTNITCKMTSLAELKVVEYILRHTWGFSEYDKPKKITTDEFMHGRKRKDGSRMDQGTGLNSKNSVIDGLRRAVENGYIYAMEDGKDKGRMKKFYALTMLNQGCRKCTSDVQKVNSGCSESEHRTEKDTTRKKKVSSINRTHRTVSKKAKRPTRTKPFSFDKFDHEAAGRLLIILENNNSDLVVAPKKVRVATLAKNITRLRIDRNVSKRDIGEMIKWLQNNYSNKYVPKMRRADDFFTHWERFKDAICRSVSADSDGTIPDDAKNTSEHKRKLELVNRAEMWICDTGRDRFHPAVLRMALEAMGEKSDAITPLFFISYGREE